MFRNQVRVHADTRTMLRATTDIKSFAVLQYDQDVVTWSPQGRIHQIEYAMEAVKQGSAAVGLKVQKSTYENQAYNCVWSCQIVSSMHCLRSVFYQFHLRRTFAACIDVLHVGTEQDTCCPCHPEAVARGAVFTSPQDV